MVSSGTSLKGRVESEVVDQLMTALNSGKITIEEAQDVAQITLSTIDSIEAHERSIIDFYESLAKKHPAFEILYTKIKGELMRAHEVTGYKKALAALNTGDIESAKNIANIALVKTANETNINQSGR